MPKLAGPYRYMCPVSSMEAPPGSQIYGVSGINRKLTGTVSWSSAMATATDEIEVIYEVQQ
jgi:hypothetical protein